MKLLIGIDDTDNLDSIGTGDIAMNLGVMLKENGFGAPSSVSRHQLYFNDLIPYTSHNSAMCFELAQCKLEDLESLISFCADYLERSCADGSDPGLCISTNLMDEEDRSKLIDYGRKAKQEVLTKDDAYTLAKELDVHLSEHGGDGMGVIGALAGVALRMDGNDGRYKGQINIAKNQDNMLVKDILTNPNIDIIKDCSGYILSDDEEVYITDRVKTVRLDGQSVLLVERKLIDHVSVWKNLDKKDLKQY